jgi:hypothetical protein
MLPPPTPARCPRSLPSPIKAAHTPVGAHHPRPHSPFLASSLGAAPSPSHFSRRHLPPSPGHLTTFRSQVRSQAGSSPPPPPFCLPPASIGEPECRPGRSSASLVPPSMAGTPWTNAGRGRRPVGQVYSFFLIKIIPKSIIPSSSAKKPLGFSKISP